MTLKRNIRRVLFLLGGLVTLLLTAWLVVLFFGQKPPPSLPLPNPNGYTDILQAGHAVSGTLDDLAETNLEYLRAFVSTNTEALRLLRVGLSRECSVPTDAAIANSGTPIGDLIALRSLALLLGAEGRLAEMENRPADAAKSYLDGIRLGINISRGGLMVDHMIGVASQGMSSTSLAKLIPKLTCHQMRPLIEQLEQIDAQNVTWKEVLRIEDRFVRTLTRNPIALVSAWWVGRNTRKAAEQTHNFAVARIRLLTVELALRCCRCDEGKAFPTLQYLLPKYVHRMPTDPFNGRQLVYKQTGTNWLLYSIGPDRVDNGGKPLEKVISFYNPGEVQKRKGDVFFDSPW